MVGWIPTGGADKVRLIGGCLGGCMEKDAVQELRLRILSAIGERLFLTVRPEVPLVLGDAFAARSRRTFDLLEKRWNRLADHLRSLPIEVLTAEFSDRGDPLSDRQKEWCAKERAELRKFLHSFSILLISTQN